MGEKKKVKKNLLFANWSLFSRRNVLVWEDEDEALAGLLLMNTSALKKTDFKRSAVQKSYWDGQRNGEVLQNRCLTRTLSRRNVTSANTGSTSVNSNFHEGK